MRAGRAFAVAPAHSSIEVCDKGLRSIVVNNTITHNAHSGIVVGGGGGVSGVVVRNNILAFTDYGLAWDSTCPNSSPGTAYADHNVIFGNGGAAIDLQSCSATSTGGGNRVTDAVAPAGLRRRARRTGRGGTDRAE